MVPSVKEERKCSEPAGPVVLLFVFFVFSPLEGDGDPEVSRSCTLELHHSLVVILIVASCEHWHLIAPPLSGRSLLVVWINCPFLWTNSCVSSEVATFCEWLFSVGFKLQLSSPAYSPARRWGFSVFCPFPLVERLLFKTVFELACELKIVVFELVCSAPGS